MTATEILSRIKAIHAGSFTENQDGGVVCGERARASGDGVKVVSDRPRACPVPEGTRTRVWRLDDLARHIRCQRDCQSLEVLKPRQPQQSIVIAVVTSSRS